MSRRSMLSLITGIILVHIPLSTCQNAASVSASIASAVSSISAAAVTATATSSGAAATHTIAVGGNDHAFHPNSLKANPGDTIIFAFYPTNHSVIRTEYTKASSCPSGGCNPCVPWALIHPETADQGFFSGNIPSQLLDITTAPTWSIKINDTKPIFYYCDALQSCSPNGMVGVINPSDPNQIVNQINAAKAAPYQLAPGEAFPAEGAVLSSTSSSTTSSSSTSATSSDSTAASATTSPLASQNSSPTLSGGAIAGIVVGAIAVLILAAALFFFVGRAKTYRDVYHSEKGQGSQYGGSSVARADPWAFGAAGGHNNNNTGNNKAFDEQQQQQQHARQGHQSFQAQQRQSYNPNMNNTSNNNDPNRFSGLTTLSNPTTDRAVPAPTSPSSPVPTASQPGHFLGYNRQTGAPEFAAEGEVPPISNGGGGNLGSNGQQQQQQQQQPRKAPSIPFLSPLRGSKRQGHRGSFVEVMGDIPK